MFRLTEELQFLSCMYLAFTQDVNVKKLFKLIATIRKKPHLQAHALNRSASSGEDDDMEEGEEEDSLTKSEFSDAGDDGFPEIKTQKLM